MTRAATNGNLTRLLVAAVLATIAGALPVFMTGALAVQLQADLGFDAARLGLAVAVPFAAAAATSTAFGRVAESIGAGRALRATSLLAALIMVGLSLAPSWGVLVVLLALSGFNNALAQPAANLLLARAVEPGRQGLAFGVKQSGMPASAFLAGLAVPVLALTVGWEWAFVAGAGLAVVAACVAPVPKRPIRAGGRTISRDGDAPLGPLIILAVGIAGGAAATGALSTFLVSAAVASGLGDGAAGLLLVLGSGVGIAVRLFAGVRADRREGRHLPVVATMLLGGATAFLLMAVGESWAVVLATPFAFGLGWAWPGLFNFTVVRLNPNAPGAATGITQTGTYIGAVLGPLTFGLLVQFYSYGIAWLVASTWYVVGAAAMLIGRRQMVRFREQSTSTSATPTSASQEQGQTT